MANYINLETPASGVTNGMELSFRAPCNCDLVDGIRLEGQNYQIVDASGNSLTSCSKYFAEGAILTVIIDTSKRTATLLNPNVNNYTKTLGTAEDTPNEYGETVWARVKGLLEFVKEEKKQTDNHKDWITKVSNGTTSVPNANNSENSELANKLVPLTDREVYQPDEAGTNSARFNAISSGMYLVIATSNGKCYNAVIYYEPPYETFFKLGEHNVTLYDGEMVFVDGLDEQIDSLYLVPLM